MNQRSMQPNLASAKDVLATIAALGLTPPDQNALQAIQRNCRDDFIEHLSACVAGQDADGKHRKAVEGLLACLTSEIGEAVRSIGLIPTFNALAQVGNKAPARFLSAIPIAKDTTHERHSEAKAFVTMVLTAPAPAPVPPQSAPVAVPSQSDPPQAQLPSEPPLARSEPPVLPASEPAAYPMAAQPEGSVQQQKGYVSQHVYGSGYALCFNASEWEGKPGVMVDAAVSNGPKSYDWKTAVHIWLDVREVAAVLAVFRKRRPSVEFAAHGAQNDKSFSMAFQGAHFYVKVAARNKGVRGVKMLSTDATAVSVLFLRQLGRAYPDLSLDTVLDLAMSCNELGNGPVQNAA